MTIGRHCYDERNSRIGIDQVSLKTLKGRISIKTDMGGYQRARFHNIKGECDLIRRNGVFYLIVSRQVDEPPISNIEQVLGVDLGVENI